MPIPFLVNSVKGLYCNTESLPKTSWTRFVNSFMTVKASRNLNKILPQLSGNKILDVGLGAGTLSCLLMKKGFDVTGLDVCDLSIYEDLKPTIYNGTLMPYKDNEFDVSLLISVLHHCEDPTKVISEAKRVAKRTIIIDDTFTNPLEKVVVSVNDMITNGEFYFHKYRRLLEWEEVLKGMGYKVVFSHQWSEFPAFVIYCRYCIVVIE